MKALKTLKQELLNNPAIHAAYNAQEAEFSIAHEMIAARIHAGLTQEQMAMRMGTTQSTIARLESGKRTPSMRTVQRYAEAAGCRAILKLEPLHA
jgi:DNA-binding XRE family transcriptional regulator